MRETHEPRETHRDSSETGKLLERAVFDGADLTAATVSGTKAECARCGQSRRTGLTHTLEPVSLLTRLHKHDPRADRTPTSIAHSRHALGGCVCSLCVLPVVLGSDQFSLGVRARAFVSVVTRADTWLVCCH